MTSFSDTAFVVVAFGVAIFLIFLLAVDTVFRRIRAAEQTRPPADSPPPDQPPPSAR